MKKFSLLTLFAGLFLLFSCTKDTEDYDYLIEYVITGNASPITVAYNNENDVRDSVTVTSLPHKIQLRKNTINKAHLRASKLTNAGTITVETRYKGKKVKTQSTEKEHGQVYIIFMKEDEIVAFDIQPDEWECGIYNGNRLRTGPKGGCYYLNSNGNKIYVDRGYCNCQ